METLSVRRNIMGHNYTITAIRRTPAKQRRSTGQPWQFFAEFEDSYRIPDWYPASTQSINEIRRDA